MKTIPKWLIDHISKQIADHGQMFTCLGPLTQKQISYFKARFKVTKEPFGCWKFGKK